MGEPPGLAPRRRRALIAAGGTGGHFYPGLVLAQTLKARGWEPLVAVRRGDSALATLEREGVASLELDLGGLPRRPGLELATYPFRLLSAARLVARVLSDFRPDVVVGTGGYLSAPCLLAAAWRRIPRAVHESNVMLGLANRLCRACGAAVFWGLPAQDGGGRLTGTPIRPSLWKRGDRGAARAALGLEAQAPTVLVFGGSQGARSLNRTLPEVLGRLAREGAGLQVLHLAGRGNASGVEAAYRREGLAAKVLEFLDSMELAYAAADLAVCRSGASTLAELAAQALPALLAPYPHAAAGHQEANARALERAGAARVVLDVELQRALPAVLRELLVEPGSPARREAMAGAFAALGLPAPDQAAERLTDAVEALAGP